MSSNKLFIAGDWGTSNLRLYLCRFEADAPSTIIDTRYGPGISEISGDFEDKFFSLTQDWMDSHGTMPVLLSGMVGSTIGWKEAPYINCPTTVEQIADGRFSFSARGVEFSILAGLRTQNPLGSPDVMRGEELQLLGWMKLNGQANERRLFALPGTHNKWAKVENSKIDNFLTAFTGELFALLRRDSILITDDSAISFNEDVFLQGVRAVEGLGGAHLIHALFATRSKQVLGEMAASDGLSYLSGLLAAADVMGALTLFEDVDAITVIAEPALTSQYTLVLDYLGLGSDYCDPAQIALAGFETIYQNLYT